MVATLIRVLRDFDAAEEAVQDAFAKALETWPAQGVPANPAAWITTTARNRTVLPAWYSGRSVITWMRAGAYSASGSATSPAPSVVR